MKEVCFEEPGEEEKGAKPCILVIFGATGDLTGRKLMPAVYHLAKDGLLPSSFACVGFARRQKSREDFQLEMKKDIETFSRTKPVSASFWNHFATSLFYHQAEFDDDSGYASLQDFLQQLDHTHKTKGNRIFYLSVQPKFFPLIIGKLKKHGLIYDPRVQKERFSRVIIEKPFGHDHASAKKLQKEIEKSLTENQIYRIDHYLGKETVQNILVFRFANAIFESVWNNRYIDHIQITVSENIGIGTRGHFFEEQGILRDIVQNHMMQLLSLTAMEPPASLSADAIRGEKVKVLECLRCFTEKEVKDSVVRGQYSEGFIEGKKVASYIHEKDVAKGSFVETFLAMRLFIDNWRWAGVPFYLRAGKRLPKRGTEIAVIFKDAPGILFKQQGGDSPNVLAIRIQPDEGISMKMNCKVPGPESPIQPVKMDFRYGSYFGKSSPEAYERLIWDCMLGDNTLFARTDEVENSWDFFDPLLRYFQNHKNEGLENYEAGSWGPLAAEHLLEKDGRKWRVL